MYIYMYIYIYIYIHTHVLLTIIVMDYCLHFSGDGRDELAGAGRHRARGQRPQGRALYIHVS